MSARNIGRTLLVIIALIAGVVRVADYEIVQAQAQSSTASAKPASAQTSITTLKVTSRETVVDVTVTDKDGKPVHGLTRGDFTVQEDGKEQPIRSFEEFGSVTPAPTATSRKLPPNTYTNFQQAPPSSAVNILLLDFVNTSIGRNPGATPIGIGDAIKMQRHVKEDAIKYLQRIPSGTRVAVLAMTYPGRLRILQGVTSDPTLLIAAVNSLEYNLAGSPSIDMTLESMKQIASVASQIKGRKNLIWLTYGLLGMTDPIACGVCDLYVREFHQYFGLLTDAQVTVYTVDARGLYTQGSNLEQSEEMLSQESVAEAGGGIAYYNSNDLEMGIAKAVENGSHYYTLTYVPPGTEYDGRHHTINVTLNPARPGVQLIYRDSYYAEDPATLLPKPVLTLTADAPPADAGNMNAAMSRSMPTSTQLLFDVKVEANTEPPSPTDPAIMGSRSQAEEQAPDPLRPALRNARRPDHIQARSGRDPQRRTHLRRCRIRQRRGAGEQPWPDLPASSLRRRVPAVHRDAVPVLSADRPAARPALRPHRHPRCRLQQSRHAGDSVVGWKRLNVAEAGGSDSSNWRGQSPLVDEHTSLDPTPT